MNNLTLIGVVGRDAQVGYFKPDVGAAVTTFWIATKTECTSSGSQDGLTTWHKITAYGPLQRFAATIQKGDVVAVSGPIYTASTPANNRQAQSHTLHAKAVELLQRNDTPYANPHAKF